MMQATNILPLWQQPAPVATEDPVVNGPHLQYQGKDDQYLEQLTEDTAQAAAIKSLLIMDDHGYCLWRLHKYEGIVICLAADRQDPRVPQGYPCFTPEELEMCCEMELATFKLTCEAKLRGATVISVEDKEKAI